MTKSTFKFKRTAGKQPVIVQILPALVRGGVERGTVEMAQAIQAAGGRAIVISNGGPMVRHVERCGGRHVRLPVHSKNPLHWWRVRRQVKAVLEEESAHIVHVRSRVPAWIALPAAKALNIATISTVHSRFTATSFFKRRYNAKLLDVGQVIAISDYVKSLITKQYNDVTARLTVVHRGVDTALFDPAAVNQSRIINFAESVALPEDVPVVMLPARATLWKGHHILLDALAKLGDMRFICLLVGAGDGKPSFVRELTNYALACGLEGRFRLTPVVDDMPAALMVADVVVMPSVTPEPFGRVALEAQAMGRPIVAFAHGGAMESIQHGETGWLATPGDSDSLAEHIKTALSLTPAARKRYAKASRTHIEAHFSTAEMCYKTLKIYQKVLSKPQKRATAR
jgi:glycosyltransferase involved in cell wall biosynthesis